MGLSDGRLAYQLGTRPLQPDWLAGMFLMADSESFRAIGGFDEGFHLYYEDVDLCARMRKAGKTLFLCPEAHVIHDARRSSRRELRYLRWHISSLVRYLSKHWGRLPKVRDVASWPS
ncbi:MAG: hypothetical protein HXY26_11815 [Hydrogenophilaceae bacterium]|nr:hypothetical protein [Hydrogenophilaceae bacterium]